MGTGTTKIQSRGIALQKEGQSSGRVVLLNDGRNPGQPHGEVSLTHGRYTRCIGRGASAICSTYDLDVHHV